MIPWISCTAFSAAQLPKPKARNTLASRFTNLNSVEFSKLVWCQYRDVVNEKGPRLHGVMFSSRAKCHCHYRATTPIIDKLLATPVEYGTFCESISDAKVATVKCTKT